MTPALALRPPRRAGRAFTLLELLIVIAIVTLLVGLIIGVVTTARRGARQSRCLSNLRQIHAAFLTYATDHSGLLPDPGGVGQSWEDVLAPSLPDARVLKCDADEELQPLTGVSYDWRDTGRPATTLAGRMLVEAKPSTVLAFEAMPGWHQKHRMNAVWADGSAHVMSDHDGLNELQSVLRILAPGTDPSQ
ncbi:MAG: type II secretion system protein [Tepidisphaeraceae bacterium]